MLSSEWNKVEYSSNFPKAGGLIIDSSVVFQRTMLQPTGPGNLLPSTTIPLTANSYDVSRETRATRGRLSGILTGDNDNQRCI